MKECQQHLETQQKLYWRLTHTKYSRTLHDLQLSAVIRFLSIPEATYNFNALIMEFTLPY